MPNTGNEINETKLMDLLNKMVGEMGAAAAGALVLLGDRLGLYKELAESGPLNSTDLAERTGTHERYVREWLACSAASGYIEHDAANSLFSMTPSSIP